ncbi:MAG: glycosyltransferase [Candidatus Omnitrophota bacterium]|jgi:GT2 family glycosyltransferase
MNKLTILTVTCGREETLESYLKNLVSCRYFADVQALILANDASHSTEKILEFYHTKYNNINFIKSARLGRGQARNTLLQESQSEFVYFLDDDIILPLDTLSVALENIDRYPQVDILGGPNLTPPGSNLFKTAQGYVLGSFFATLWMSRRYYKFPKAVSADERTLILCNLIFRRSIFKHGDNLFDSSVIAGEENLLLRKLMAKGHRAMYIPDLIIYHERRKSYIEFCRQIFTYGAGRYQTIRNYPGAYSIIYFMPAIFLIYLLSLLLYRPLYLQVTLFIYLLPCAYNSLKYTWLERKIRLLPISLILFPTIHLMYGAGFVIELIKPLFGWTRNVSILAQKGA